MRVIAGSARRLLLKTPKGMETRPTQDRVKETLFNILQDDIPGSYFIDLYAGSGQMGIEALSRGARHAWFVDQGKDAIGCIKDNLVHTRLDRTATVISSDVLQAISVWDHSIVPDIVFMDPPYDHDYEKQVLLLLRDRGVIDQHTIVIVEASLHTDLEYAQEIGYTVTRTKKYKTNQHIFLSLN